MIIRPQTHVSQMLNESGVTVLNSGHINTISYIRGDSIRVVGLGDGDLSNSDAAGHGAGGFAIKYLPVATNFDICCRLANALTLNTSMGFGFRINVDDSNWLICRINRGADSKTYAQHIKRVAASTTTVYQPIITYAAPAWLRVVRSGDNWTCYYALSSSGYPAAWTAMGAANAAAIGAITQIRVGTQMTQTQTFSHFILYV